MKATPRDWLVLALLVLGVGAATQWWAARQRSAAGEQLAAVVQPGDIRMLSSETCGICSLARAWFTEHRIAFSECLIERDATCRSDFEATRAPGTPVLLVRGQPVLGFDPQRLVQLLQPAG